MADKRAYFKLDVGYLTNPKVAAIGIESPTAVLLHIGSIGYAAQHLTDGEVPVLLLLRLTGAGKQEADLLFASGLWERGRKPGLAVVHDYLKHQRSSTEVKGASDAAKRAAKARWDADGNADGMPDAMHSASESAMPREKEREKEREKNIVVPTMSDERPDVDRICDHLADRIEANGALRPTIGKAWLTAARLLLDKDGRPEAEIHQAIDWVTADDFWRANVLSMPKLREKYDQLKLAAARKPPGRKNDHDWDLTMQRARAIDNGETL